MRKVIIFLQGTGQKEFVDLARKQNYWVWNVGTRDYEIPFHPRFFEWKLLKEKDDNVEDYIPWVADKFEEHEYSNILFVHGYTEDLKEIVQTDYECYFIDVVKDNKDSLFCNYDVCLNVQEKQFEEKAIKILSILTKEIQKENENGNG